MAARVCRWEKSTQDGVIHLSRSSREYVKMAAWTFSWLILKHLQDLAGRTLQKCKLREDEVRQACKLVEPVLPVRVSGDH